MKPVTSKCWALSNIYIRLVICIGNRWFVILKSELNLQNFRDIKPSNFSVGLGEKAKNIYLYDFGLSRQYKGKIWNVAHIIWGLSIWLSWMVDIIGMCKIDVDESSMMTHDCSLQISSQQCWVSILHWFFWVCKSLEVNGEIKEPRPIVSFQGTMTYAAVNAHNKVELGRQDDLYSLFYIILEFIKGIQSSYTVLIYSFKLKVAYRGVIWKKKKKLDHSSQQ